MKHNHPYTLFVMNRKRAGHRKVLSASNVSADLVDPTFSNDYVDWYRLEQLLGEEDLRRTVDRIVHGDILLDNEVR